jgi:hypothetical protein
MGSGDGRPAVCKFGKERFSCLACSCWVHIVGDADSGTRHLNRFHINGVAPEQDRLSPGGDLIAEVPRRVSGQRNGDDSVTKFVDSNEGRPFVGCIYGAAAS